MDNIEIWKPIINYDGLYEISNLGRVKSFKQSCKLKNIKEYFLKVDTIHPSGYFFIMLIKNGIRTSHSLHRTVAIHFIENPLKLPQVNHKDTNKANNVVSNLEWCTNEYNRTHCMEHGLHPHGDIHPRRKVSSIQVKEIRKMYESGQKRICELARMYPLTVGAVSSIVKYRVWKSV